MAQICFQNKKNNFASLCFLLHLCVACVLQTKGNVDTVPTVHVPIILKQIYDRVLHRYIPNTWFADYVSSRDTNVIEVDDSGI